jgi:hypothetical protein
LLQGELNYALSFAIDRSWPIFEGGSFSKHNPAVILFLKPRKFTKRNKTEVVCHVGKQKPITDKHLKEQILRRPRDSELYEEFKRELKKSGRATKKRDVGKSLSN